MILLQDLTGLDDGAVNAVQKAAEFSLYDAAGVTEMMMRFGFFMVVLFFIVYFLLVYSG